MSAFDIPRIRAKVRTASVEFSPRVGGFHTYRAVEPSVQTSHPMYRDLMNCPALSAALEAFKGMDGTAMVTVTRGDTYAPVIEVIRVVDFQPGLPAREVFLADYLTAN